MRFYRQPDKCTKEIAAAIRAVPGWRVEYLENSSTGGTPDLMIGGGGITYLMECKSPEAKYRTRKKGGRTLLSESQEEWLDKWRGGPYIVAQTVPEAFAALGITQPHLEV